MGFILVLVGFGLVFFLYFLVRSRVVDYPLMNIKEKMIVFRAFFGFTESQYYLGLIYAKNAERSDLGDTSSVRQNINESLKWFQIASLHGYDKATKMANRIILLHQKPRNLYVLAEMCIKRAKKGRINDTYFLGVLYEYGIGIRQSMSEAIVWYMKAAKKGHPKAQYRMGMHYIDNDKQTGLKLIEASASSNYHKALNTLGEIYEKGELVAKDLSRAFSLYSSAADMNDIDACNNLGRLYGQGLGVDQDYLLSAEFYHKSAVISSSFRKKGSNTKERMIYDTFLYDFQ